MNVHGHAIPLVDIEVYANAWTTFFHHYRTSFLDHNRASVFHHYRRRRGRGRSYVSGGSSRWRRRLLTGGESQNCAGESQPGKERECVLFHLVDSSSDGRGRFKAVCRFHGNLPLTMRT